MKIHHSSFIIHHSKKLLYLGSALAVALAIIIGVSLLWPKTAAASWYDDNWNFRKAVTVTVTSSASDIKDLETLITVDTTGITASLQTNCEDLRFTNQTGDLLPYYAPSCSDNSATNKVWVLADLVPKNTTTYTMYMYYGNPSAPQGSDSNKFRLFNGLVGYWTMNEASWAGVADEVKDSSVNTNHGVRSGDATTTASGKYSYGGTFDGTGDYAEITNNAALRPADNFTISAWMKTSTANTWGTIFGSYSEPTSLAYGIALQVTNGNKARVFSGKGTGVVDGTDYEDVVGTTNITDNAWHHLVGAYNTTDNKLKLYVDGNFEGETSWANDPAYHANNRVSIGAIYATSFLMLYTGTADDVRLYNRDLSAAEITQLYNTPGTIASTANATVKPSTSFATEEKAPGPSAYWAFDEGTGTNAQDSTTNNNDGTLTNGPTWQTEDQCLVGKCLKFDGSDDQVNLPSIAFGSSFTMSAWVKRSTATGTYTIVDFNDNTNVCYLRIGETNANAASFACSGSLVITDTANISDSQWHYVTGVKDSSTAAYLYVDGKLIASDTSYTTASSFTSTQSRVGRELWGGTNYYPFDGYIDEVKVYPYARTQAQINADYNSRGSVKGSSANLGTSPTGPPVLNEGLVGYWKMNDNVSGNTKTLVDSSTSGNNSTTYYGANAAGMDCTVAGKYNGGCDFDGTDDYVLITDNASYDFTTAFTLSYWFKMDTVENSVMFNKRGGTTEEWQFTIADSTGIKVQFCLNTSGSLDCQYSAVVAPGTSNWHHLVAVYNGSTMKAYYDGQQVISADKTGNLQTGNSDIYIGKYAAGAGYEFDGQIDEVRMYNRALSADDVSTLYGQAPVGYWDFEEGSGTSANDTSTLANTGTITNALWSNGKYGKGLKFDGAGDYVTRADDTDFDFAAANNFTVEAYVKHNGAIATNSDYILTKGDATNGGYQLYMDSSGNFCFGVDDDGNPWGPDDTACSSGTNYSNDNKWHHLAGVKTGTTKIELYLDGVLVGSDATIAATGTLANTGALYIGIDTDGSSNSWDGWIDEPKIYNYARSAKQIVSDMNAGHPNVGSPVGSAIGHWKMDEGVDNTCLGGTNDACNSGSAGSAIDGAGSGFASPATSTSGWTQAGKFGRALIFDGSNDTITVTDNTALNPVNISISVWVNPTSAAPAKNSDLVAKRTVGNVGGYILQQEITSGKAAFYAYVSGAWVGPARSDSALPASTWSHVVATYDGATVKVYINGKQGGTTASSTGTIASVVADLQFGSDSIAGNEYSGSIDEVKIYNYALTPNEILTEFNRGSSLLMGSLSDNSSYQVNAANQEYCVPGDTTSCAAPVGRWDFEEGSGTSANDSSGGNSTGTITGATYTVGKQGKALNFNGSTDTVTVSNSLSTKTVSFWVNPSSTTQNLLDLRTAATAASISVSSGTIAATGFTSPTIYVNGIVSSTLAANSWQYVTVTTGTAITANAIRFGRISSTSLTGKLDSIKIFDYARSAAQVALDYNKGAPVGHWKMDECQGDRANDSSGNSNTGTITIGALGEDTIGTCNTSSTAWGSGATGKRNASLSLDGTDDYVSLGTDPLQEVSATNLSIAMWLYVNPTTFNASYKYLMDSATGNINNDGFNMYLDDRGSACWTSVDGIVFAPSTTTGTGRSITSESSITSTGWYHLAATYDGSNGKIYINGQDRTSYNGRATCEGTGNYTPRNANLYLGAQNDGSTTGTFNGQVDDVKIFNYALTATQVKTLYNNGAINFSPSTGTP